jgi:ketosteroid isomerase-like protein
MDRAQAQAWLDDYVSAWKSYDRDEIAALFAEDVSYRYHPYDEPLVGREAVVDTWLGVADRDGSSTRDAPGTYDGHYTPYAVDGDVVVATGTSVYQDHPDGPVTRTFDNCFLVRFDDDGRCAEFTELYMQRPR